MVTIKNRIFRIYNRERREGIHDMSWIFFRLFSSGFVCIQHFFYCFLFVFAFDLFPLP